VIHVSRVTLGEVCTEYKGRVDDVGNLPIVGLEHLSQSDIDLLGCSHEETTFTKGFLKGHVLFGRRRAYLKKASLAPFDGVCSGDIIVIEAKDGKLFPGLLPFIIQNDFLFDFAVENSAGSLSPRVKWKDLSRFEFDLPLMEEQEKLAELLWAAQETKRVYARLLLACDEMVKSRFIEMFGSDVDSTPWSVEKVEHIADVTVGVVIKPAQYYVEDASQGVRAFRSLNVQPMHVKDGDWVYFSIEGHEKNGKSSLKASDVLIVRSGYPGTSCVVGPEYEGSNAIDLIIAHPDLERINPTYLAAFNNCPIGQQQIQSGVGGAAQQHFNVGRYKSLKIPVPPLELQREFADFFAQVDKSEFALKQAIDSVSATMTSILNQELGMSDV